MNTQEQSPNALAVRSRATSVSNRNGHVIVTYFGVAVLEFTNDEITLRSGGHNTATTKRIINNASALYNLGLKIEYRGGEWFVKHPALHEVKRFRSGMTVARHHGTCAHCGRLMMHVHTRYRFAGSQHGLCSKECETRHFAPGTFAARALHDRSLVYVEGGAR